MREYTPEVFADLLPYPTPNLYKYSRGRLILVVGSRAYPGAAGLASLAGQRAGAGYTEVYVEDSIVQRVQIYAPSLVVRAWSEWDSAHWMPRADEHRPRAYVLGCGFDATDPYIANVTRQILKRGKAPVLVDGGALQMLSARKIHALCEPRMKDNLPTIITPHFGEAVTLAQAYGIPTEDPTELAKELARHYHATCVLKGPNTYISDGEDCYCMTEGTAALSKAGTGDVLAGIIGALLAQSVEPVDACVLGTTLHARAGRLAAADLTSIAVTPEDIIRYIPQAVLSLGKGRTE